MDVGTANATFSATLVDQWVRCGVRAAFIAPGSRSTPLAVALIGRAELRVELLHDERSASFAALGWGLATGEPAVLLCTSGTATTHFHGAIAEAGISCVPIIACTANRPPELWDRGAAQTIDQTDLYRNSVRGFFRPGPPDEGDPDTWRPLANDVWFTAVNAAQPGPVQLDLSFREPLLGATETLPVPIELPSRGTSATATGEQISAVADRVLADGRSRRGVIVVGRGESEPAAIATLAQLLGWPVIADHRSGLRGGTALRFHDTILRRSVDLTEETECVLRFGEPLSSKVLGQWIQHIGSDPDAVTGFAPWGRVIDPENVISHRLPERTAAELLLHELGARGAETLPHWRERWRDADIELRGRAAEVFADPNCEPAIVAAALAAVPSGGALVVASSMPVRDIEWFGPDSDATVLSCRGANGIDGTIATAIGVASIGTPTVCLLGDVAFLHDQPSLTALARRSIDLTIVVIDNDGGGIFSFLPQHDQLPEAHYEFLFGTPHGTDIAGLCQAHGLPVTTDLQPRGVKVAVFTTNRADGLDIRRRFTYGA